MAKFNTENSSTLSRFAKDKRVRTATPERTERSERNFSRPKRSSYNPHFTEDNRLRDEYATERNERPARSSRPARPARPDAKPFGKRTDSKPFGKRTDSSHSASAQTQNRLRSAQRAASRARALTTTLANHLVRARVAIRASHALRSARATLSSTLTSRLARFV